jgi:hypothetical protein
MKKFTLMLLVSFVAVLFVSCASEEVKEPAREAYTPPKVEEPKPSKKPKLDDAYKVRKRDIK